MADNHQRHRPSTAIIRRHARLLRARYVDLLQKTLLPSFLLAGSRHALFSTLLPPLAVYYLCLSFFRRLFSLLASPIFPLLDAMPSSSECAHTHSHASLGVHIPGETLKCTTERANTHACPSRVPKRWTPGPPPPRLPHSPFLIVACPSSSRSSLILLTLVCTLRDVRVCQWNTLSLNRADGGDEASERKREREIGGGTVPGNSGSRSGAGGGKLGVGGYSWHIGAVLGGL